MNLNLLPKVGPKTINILNKININTIEDLLTYYPYRYNVIKFVNIQNTDETMTYYIKAKVLSAPKVSYIKRNFNRLDFIATNNEHDFKVVIFNRAFLKRNLTINKEIVLIGKYSKIKNTFTANDIKFNIDEERIEPIYHLTSGITSKNISQGGKSAFTYILKPSPAKQGATDGNASALNWETSDTATCIAADLCFSKKLTTTKSGS